jgi:hypothetical protein
MTYRGEPPKEEKERNCYEEDDAEGSVFDCPDGNAVRDADLPEREYSGVAR